MTWNEKFNPLSRSAMADEKMWFNYRIQSGLPRGSLLPIVVLETEIK